MKKYIFYTLVFLSAFAKAQTTTLNQKTVLKAPTTAALPTAEIISRNPDGTLVNTGTTVTQLDKQNLSEFNDDIGATDPVVSKTYFVHPTLGDDTTGQFENANKPYRTIDAILDLFPRNGTDTNAYVKIFLLSDGNYPINNAIGYYDLEFVSESKAFIDLTNFGDPNSGVENVYYASNVSGVYDIIFNLPRGGIKNTSSNNGGRFLSEDVRGFLNVDEVNWTAGNVILEVYGGVFVEKINTFNSNGIILAENTINIETLNSKVASPFGGADVNVTNLITNNVTNLIPSNATWKIKNIEGDLEWLFSHNKTYNIIFDNCTWNTGKLNFKGNTGNFNFSGILNRMEYDPNIGIFDDMDATSDRIPNITFQNFTCLDFIGRFNTNGSFYFWNFINCYIRKSDNYELLFLKNNSNDGNVVIQKTTFIQADNNSEVIIKTGSGISTVNIEVGGLETNASSITNNGALPIIFDVVSFKDKLGELVVRNEVDLVNKDLDPTITYIIDGTIELSAGEYIRVPSTGNLTLNGYGLEASKIIKNVAGESIFKSPVGGSGGLQLQGLSFSTTGSVFDIEDFDGSNAIEVNTVNFKECASLGELDGYRQFLGTTVGIYGVGEGFTLSGAMSGFKLTNTNIFGFDATGTLFKEGTGLTFSNRFYTELNASLPTGALISDFQESNFLNNELFQITNSIVELNGIIDESNTDVLIPNIEPNSPKSRWVNNIGIENTTLSQNDTGWAQYTDTQYTDANRFAVAANTSTNLPNNALNILEIQKPNDIETFYDPATQKILGRNGDGISWAIEAKVTATNTSADWVRFAIDIGGAVGEIYPQTTVLPLGLNETVNVVYNIPSAYTLNTWEANGGQVKVSSDGTITLHDIRYVITRTHKAK